MSDQNVVDLQSRIGEALDELAKLDRPDANNVDSARSVWDWIFKSDGFFAEFDRDRKQQEKEKALLAKAALIGSGARTSAYGVLGLSACQSASYASMAAKRWINPDRAAEYRHFLRQKSLIEQHFPCFECHLYGNRLSCKGKITPSEDCDRVSCSHPL